MLVRNGIGTLCERRRRAAGRDLVQRGPGMGGHFGHFHFDKGGPGGGGGFGLAA